MQARPILSALVAATLCLGASLAQAANPTPQPRTALPELCDLINSMLCDLELAK